VKHEPADSVSADAETLHLGPPDNVVAVDSPGKKPRRAPGKLALHPPVVSSPSSTSAEVDMPPPATPKRSTTLLSSGSTDSLMEHALLRGGSSQEISDDVEPSQPNARAMYMRFWRSSRMCQT
jgi:hypothetical protein